MTLSRGAALSVGAIRHFSSSSSAPNQLHFTPFLHQTDQGVKNNSVGWLFLQRAHHELMSCAVPLLGAWDRGERQTQPHSPTPYGVDTRSTVASFLALFSFLPPRAASLPVDDQLQPSCEIFLHPTEFNSAGSGEGQLRLVPVRCRPSRGGGLSRRL